MTRERPAAAAALSRVQGVAPAGSPEEPVLDVHDIQGNGLVGFNKDYQTFVFLKITDATATKAWLRDMLPFIATIEETLADRRLFRALRHRRGAEPRGHAATWTNIAFTWEGLRKLTSEQEAGKFRSEAFRLGMHARAAKLGDRTDKNGRPIGWVVGDERRYPDVLIIAAGDQLALLRAVVKGIKADLARRHAMAVLYEQEGATLPGALSGHEHFGFKDGISQPGVRGRVSDTLQDFLEPRFLDPGDPLALTHARPGRPLVWPGQFVLGGKYPIQDGANPIQPQQNAPPDPAWASNGSFLVVRRLRQDVARFWTFAADQAKRLSKRTGVAEITPERFASLLVGRWPSGAPIMRAPERDDVDLAANPVAANQFAFTNPSPPATILGGSGLPADTFAAAPGDADGRRCPFASHLRKVNPRDDLTEIGGPNHTLPKRILRRGIPFGPPLLRSRRATNARTERGLVFVCYQASIESQFEFLTTDWVNSTVNPRSYDAGNGMEQAAGFDPIIGQTSKPFALPLEDGSSFDQVPVPGNLVVTTGGGYFFAPSISALRDVLSV